MAQNIVIQVGQCGNQIGSRFWEMALQEHAAHNPHGYFDSAMSTFFRNNPRRSHPAAKSSHAFDETERIHDLKVRGVAIDMEEGVINHIRSSPLGHFFGEDQYITSQSGCGNNWGRGYVEYGELYHERIEETLRRQAERCDVLQGIFMTHSLGGGTGSGLGSYVFDLISDMWPTQYKFSMAAWPSEVDDVVTSPYNSILALDALIRSADCVLPLDNNHLLKMAGDAHRASETPGPGDFKERRVWDAANSLAGRVLLDMTSSMRFEGGMNVDLNDIVTNLVPFPRQKFVLASIPSSPSLGLTALKPAQSATIFREILHPKTQLMAAEPSRGTYLACALLLRGPFTLVDIRRNVDLLRGQMTFVHWQADAWKVGLCYKPSYTGSRGILTLANNTSILKCFQEMERRFLRLYRRRANLHHYLQFLEVSQFTQALDNLRDVVAQYHESGKPPPSVSG
ncbi:hypothetical protein CXG81DRAFT_12192 [Caulochytrium protostelioides]|uniref:Tubulin epsilon chain n=1 Tax=Caulochytrium protostelioides TaxID=1555241 RepID=A0A4P9X242_9FUNG|nr:tubulin epsilon chain [Caulochytrium protostelioides]RKP01296.1 hypothetical protein CXG81DRAFT_12192 [Caulochytrium protostelioides]|eukprot:RKP01296.1 hypothetical protein CXG81DRAFT_12192 [Caulochytrium protostelioides]